MFPIGKPTLSLREIANYWAREIQPSASQFELLRLLEGAWWLGEIRGDSVKSRLDLLKLMFQAMHDRDDLGIIFVVEGVGEPRTEQLPDGSVVDVRHRICLPSRDISTWNESSCEDAFQSLAQTSSTESYPEMTPGLAWIELTFEEFTDWLASQGYAKPKFWKPLFNQLKSANRGRPAEYNWIGVQQRLTAYARDNGPIQNSTELIQKCADFAAELHPNHKTPDDSTIRAAIQRYRLDTAVGVREK